MKRIFIIGAGQLGSRHLQALKSVKKSLSICVLDPSQDSLNIAKERYDSIQLNDNNIVSYNKSLSNVNSKDKVDIVIIATGANVRAIVTFELLNSFKVDTIVFEKILFQKREDYFTILQLLKDKKTKAYVNCCMRMMSFYKDIKELFKDTKFKYLVSGSQYGLVTNLIHYIDHVAFLNDSTSYMTNTDFLEDELIESKRKGFYELNGTFQVNFENGTQGIFTCESRGESPIVIQAFNDKAHFISRESEGKVWLSKASNDWKWEEVEFNIPFQSQLTTELIEELFTTKGCSLPNYEESMKIHLPLLDSLLLHINKENESKFDIYPFT